MGMRKREGKHHAVHITSKISRDFRTAWGKAAKEAGVKEYNLFTGLEGIPSSVEGQKFIAANVSEYGSTMWQETFAESFAAWTSPLYETSAKRLPRQVEEFFVTTFRKAA
jgi:hypothetical protein